jgi:hypothetical protein
VPGSLELAIHTLIEARLDMSVLVYWGRAVVRV